MVCIVLLTIFIVVIIINKRDTPSIKEKSNTKYTFKFDFLHSY